MSTFFVYILAAMAFWVPIKSHCYWPVTQKCLDDTAQHYVDIAKDIAEVISEPGIKLPFTGDNYKAKSALLMISIATTESGFNRNVDSCKTVGDNGVAFGLWQTHTGREGTCSDRKVALRKAIEIVNQSFIMCKNFSLLDRMAGYTNGVCSTNSARSRIKMAKAIGYLTAHPYTEPTIEPILAEED